MQFYEFRSKQPALDTIDNALDRMQDIAEGRTTGKVVLTP